MRTLIFTLTMIILFGGMVFSCKKSDDQPAVTLLTFKQDASNPTTLTDDWIYATDDQGNVLDAKPYEADQVIVLQSNKVQATQKINVTILTSVPLQEIDLKTYLGIAVNSSWQRTHADAAAIDTSPLAPVNLDITNVPASTLPLSKNFSISINEGLVFPAFGSTTGEITAAFGVRPAHPSFYVATFNGNQAVYYAGNSASSSALNLNFNTDFKPVDHSFDLTFPGSTYFMADFSGIKTSESTLDPSQLNGYKHSYRIDAGLNGTVRMGYNDGFDFYKTLVTQITGGTTRVYNKMGAAPTAINMPDHSGSITGTDINNFSFAMSGTFNLRVSTWIISGNGSNIPFVNWTVVSSPDGIQRIQNIPKDILTAYPALSGTFHYYQTYFLRYLDGFTYENYVNSLMSVNPTPAYSKEYQYISF